MSNVQCLDYRDEEIFEAVYLKGRSLWEVGVLFDLSERTVKNVALATMKELAKRQFHLAQLTPIESLMLEKARLEEQWSAMMQAWHTAINGDGTWAQKAAACRFLLESRRVMRDQRAVNALLAKQKREGVAAEPQFDSTEPNFDPAEVEFARAMDPDDFEPGEPLDGTPVEGSEAIAVVELHPATATATATATEPEPLTPNPSPPRREGSELEVSPVKELVPQRRDEPTPVSLDSELLRILAEPVSPLATARQMPPTKPGPISRRAAAKLRREKQAEPGTRVSAAS